MILVKQTQRSVKPFPTPPFPSKSSTLAGSRQMAPDLFLNPIADERETPTGVTHRKVVHPTAKNRIDLFDQATDGLRLIALENNSQLAQQGRPLLDLRYPQRHPSSLTTPDPPELKAQKSKALALLQIHVSALFLIHLDLEFCQFLPNSFLDCPPKPLLPIAPILESLLFVIDSIGLKGLQKHSSRYRAVPCFRKLITVS
jgi:hypothetical protein